MTANTRPPSLARRAVLLGGLAALPGCSIYDSIFGADKKKLPGERQTVLPGGRALTDATTTRSVTLPPPVTTADWAMPGGTPAHEGGHLALPGGFNRAWTASIGESTGYRRRITTQPVVSGGRVFTMDADGVVAAFDAASGRAQWRTVTEPPDDRNHVRPIR